LTYGWNGRWRLLLRATSLTAIKEWIFLSIHSVYLILSQISYFTLLYVLFNLLLLLLKLFFLLFYDFEVLELSHELFHRVLLNGDELLKAVHLRVLLQYASLSTIQLLPMLVLHLIFELLDVAFEVVVLRLSLLLGNVKLLLKELFLSL
jgi:hypothetical protein